MLSFYKVPAGTGEHFDIIRAGFFGGDKNKIKHHLVNWQTFCLPKDQRRSGRARLRNHEYCFMIKLALENFLMKKDSGRTFN
jgi:hypothetical protein